MGWTVPVGPAMRARTLPASSVNHAHRDIETLSTPSGTRMAPRTSSRARCGSIVTLQRPARWPGRADRAAGPGRTEAVDEVLPGISARRYTTAARAARGEGGHLALIFNHIVEY